MLTPQEKEWFSALTEKRQNTVAVLKEERLINVFISQESAHFVYGLLQNAHDVGAGKDSANLPRQLHPDFPERIHKYE